MGPGLNKTRAIGNAYLASIGLTDTESSHAIQTAHKALEIIEAVDRFNECSRYQLKLRIGFDTGEEISTVVRKRKVIYDL